MGGEFEILLKQASSFERVAVGSMADRIFLDHDALEFFAETIAGEKITHTDSAAGHLIFVRGTDATRCGTDRGSATRVFCGFVHFAVIRKNQVRAITQEEASTDFDARFFKVFKLVDERGRIHHRAGPDDRFLSRAKNAARNQLENEMVAVEDYCMPGIVAARVARYVVK